MMIQGCLEDKVDQEELPFSIPTISVAKDASGYDEIIRWAHEDSKVDLITATAMFRSDENNLEESWTAVLILKRTTTWFVPLGADIFRAGK